jgi:hypothetical protein
MEVNTNFSAGGVVGTTPPARSTPSAKPAAPPDYFAGSTALNEALDNQPASRPEAVARARNLIADPNYPSSDTLRQVSNLLAESLTSENE